MREHLRACAHCRAAMRAYRAAPGAIAALLPAPMAARTLFERAHDAVTNLGARISGQRLNAESTLSQLAASGGGRGPGSAALAKALAICAGTAGTAAACIGAGVVPPALIPAGDHAIAPRVVRLQRTDPPTPQPAPEESPRTEPAPEPAPAESTPTPEPEAEAVALETAVESAPEAASAPSQAQPAPSPSAAAPPPQAAGEFGP